ncbi:PhoPQ-activated pathogenicity-related family protein [Frigoriglobus tundricola]|uniref:PhoP/Q-regulated protein PqaA n=1 Tax=Frigoriglobus tundricola TaxID=2774151 RepID=A0A6M5Z2T1_9BACT|nr:PhoPQ-activated protein PqaA family protein [Frigoriglobus tundricola]QJW99741.1 PhoP/Q-regulated protein PqaA [Frigoriglobus tundricola]
MRFFTIALGFLVAQPGLTTAAPAAPPTELVDYVIKPDDSFSWKLTDTKKTDAGTVYELDLVSQTWHDIKWEHKLQIYVLKDAKPQSTMVLWNTGGTPNLLSGVLGFQIAERVKAPVAFLFGVPKQPLFGGKKEDALIAETFVRYLDSKDGSWPLLFPMVKSVVRGMDTLQQFAKKEWDFEVKSFVITGASKRGWTTWLTAATGDKRVKAIAPIVIDTLNMPVQMKNQVAAFGKPSEMIRDYTERGLVPIPDTPEAKKLWQMIDPWVYREKVTVPKLIINGANDPYWPLDALNSYWDDLTGDKWLLYVPNAGHDLRELDKDGKKEMYQTRAVNTLSAFCYCQIFDKKMPTLSWKYGEEKESGTPLSVTPNGTMKGMRFWTAEAGTRDFRKAAWKSSPSSEAKGDVKVVVGGPVTIGLTVTRTAKSFDAVFLETEFEVDHLRFNLSTQIRILEPKQ